MARRKLTTIDLHSADDFPVLLVDPNVFLKVYSIRIGHESKVKVWLIIETRPGDMKVATRVRIQTESTNTEVLTSWNEARVPRKAEKSFS